MSNQPSRLLVVFSLLTVSLLGIMPINAQSDTLKIGIIGTGHIGGALARHWVRAGHEVFMSSRHPERLKDLADELGPRARAGMPREIFPYTSTLLNPLITILSNPQSIPVIRALWTPKPLQ